MKNFSPGSNENFNQVIQLITNNQIKGIDRKGANCTISILSFNRSEQTIQLLSSLAREIPDYAGEILILDQGSETSEVVSLQSYISNYAHLIRIHFIENNLGVAKGRNRLSDLATKDWLIFLDNDLEIKGDFFPELSKFQSESLSPIINFPLSNPNGSIFARGGTFSFELDVDQRKVGLIVEPFKEHVFPDSLENHHSTSLVFGGAVCIRKSLFEYLGKFDERYFIGFEDIDFALKALSHGIIPSTLQETYFVHAEKETNSSADLNYAQTRFSIETLNKSAMEFEDKWGVRIWNRSSEDWLKKIRTKLLGRQQEIEIASPQPSQIKKKIALIVDSEDWAFSRIGQEFQGFLDSDFEVDVFSIHTLEARFSSEGNNQKYFLLYLFIALESYDLIHFFWIGSLKPLTQGIVLEFCQENSISEADFKKRYLGKSRLSTCFYDHYSLRESWSQDLLSKFVDNFFVSSLKLQLEAEQLSEHSPAAILFDGVDIKKFECTVPRGAINVREKIRIGWVGNSDFGGGGDKKYFKKYFEPTIENLRKKGILVEVRIADPSKDLSVPHKDMPDFYRNIDLLICTSPFEGTPNPILEAMAMGVPFISNDVGIVSEVVGALQNEFVLPINSINQIVDSVIKLLSEPGLYESISKENLSLRSEISWNVRRENVLNYFKTILNPELVMTKFCTLPFTTPSMEPDGSIRLCSSTTIFGFENETNMGNINSIGGLKPIWTGEKYKSIRGKLLKGSNLTPYCASCNYRFDAPAWMLQYHLALSQYWSGDSSPEIIDSIKMWVPLHETYSKTVSTFSTSPHPAPLFLEENSPGLRTVNRPPISLISGAELSVNMDFNTLNRCNVGCIMCPPSIRIEDLGFPRDKLFTLTERIFEEVTSDVRLNSSHFVGAYAEPLMNKEIVSLVKAAKKKGSFTAITTNAMLLTEEKANELLDAGLDMLSVSLHGATKDIAEAVMRKSNFEKISGNLSKLGEIVKKRSDDLLMHINYVGMVDNISDFESVIEFAHKRGFQHVNLFALIDGDKVVDKSMSLETRPDLLKLYVPSALRKANDLGITVYVSPAYEALLK